MAYWQLFYHIVWSTKNRQPLLTSDVEPVIYNLLRTKAIGLGGVVFAINGIEEHVHFVGSVPPSLAVATFVGQIKGVSSARFNQGRTADQPRFAWQEEYGVFSFDRKRLPNVVAYVERQKQHHTENRTIPILERTEEGKVQIVREDTALYTVQDDGWWHEMLALGQQ
jgi:putative transposase